MDGGVVMNLRYPIGQLEIPESITLKHIHQWLDEIESYVQNLKKVVIPLNEIAYNQTYREGSFTVRQLVHHIADSQINLYQRLKLALTDEQPKIAEFKQDAWTQLPDSQLPVEISIQLLEMINRRITTIGRQLSKSDLSRTFLLEGTGEISVGETIAKLSWHERHHLAHIQLALGKSEEFL